MYRSLFRLLVFLPFVLLSPISAGHAAAMLPSAVCDQVCYFELYPFAVKLTGTETVSYFIETDGTLTSAVLRKPGQGSIALTKSGTRFSATLAHSRVVDGYTATSYNLNFLGYLDVYQGATLTTYNVNIGVVDSAIPHHPPTYVTSFLTVHAKYTPHMVNLKIPSLTPGEQDRYTVAKEFYNHFGDDYDFLSMIFIPEKNSNRYHVDAKNSIQGIGKAIVDYTADYGSAGRLQGINIYPIVTYFDLAERASLHEIGHQWINFLNMTQLQNVTVHWPVSTLAYGMMGFSLSGGAGGDFPWQLVALNPNSWLCVPRGLSLTYNEMELYLMGMAPSSSVPTNYSFVNQSQMCTDAGTLAGPVTTLTVQDVVNQYGPLMPSYLWSQKKFNHAGIVATIDRWLSDTELDYLDYMAARGSAMVPLPFHSGLVTGITWPFYLATRGKGCLVTSINPSPSAGCYSTRLPLVLR